MFRAHTFSKGKSLRNTKQMSENVSTLLLFIMLPYNLELIQIILEKIFGKNPNRNDELERKNFIEISSIVVEG